MNDIERLVAGLPRPSPSAELETRITRLVGTARIDRSPASDGKLALRRLAVTAASVACAGLLGFLLGRHSAGPVVASERQAVPTPGPGNSNPPTLPEQAPAVIAVQVPETDALVRFVMPSRRTAGLFGGGPFVDQSDSSELE